MAAVERSTTLDAEPGSVRAARRFVVEALVASGHPDDADTAQLLVSEIVTNAVLHARSRADLCVQIEGGRLRVSVRDTSTLLPTPRTHDRESQTGRGLELVELLSHRWGAEPDDGPEPQQGGKSVWFELELDRPVVAFAPGPEALPDPDTSPDQQARSVQVCLEGVPLSLLRKSQEHREGLIRESVLMTLDDGDATAVPARLVALSEELAGSFANESASVQAQADVAERRGDLTVDLLMEVRPGAVEAIARVFDLLEEADRYCAEGALLTLAASDAVRAFRRWCAREINSQLGGGVPNRWHDR